MKQYNGIAIAGPIGAGKDTLGNLLERYGLGKAMNIAEGIYKEVARQNGVAVEDIYNNKAKYRLELQELGARCIKDDPLYWILKMRSKKTRPYYELEKTHRTQRPIITDMRYIHEYTYFKGLGFYMVYVNAPLELLEARGSAPADSRLHASEQELRGLNDECWNYIVENDSDLLHLCADVVEIEADYIEGLLT